MERKTTRLRETRCPVAPGRGWLRAFFLVVALAFVPSPLMGQEIGPSQASGPQESRVHALLFYSPTCPHCHQVITEVLMPLQDRYGDRLVILGFDTSQQWANDLFYAALRRFKVPERDWAVPLMIVDEEVMVGGREIPERFPELLERGLEGDGIDLPSFPALLDFLEEQDLLDPRYPDRRIVRQEAPPEEEVPEEARAQTPSEDTAESPEDSLAPSRRDSVEATDSATAADTASGPRGSTTQVADTLEPGRDTAVTETETATQADSPQAPVRAERKGAQAQAQAQEEARAMDTVAGPGAEASSGGDTASPTAGARDTAAGSPASPDPDSGEEGRSGVQPRAGGEKTPSRAERGEGPVGLSDAARDLSSMSMADRFGQDPTGNSLSVVVLLLLLASAVLRGYPPRAGGKLWPVWVVPALVVVGLGVASYLSYIEVSRVEAVCGPVGDCNTVNQSEYARLFGILPVGVLGMAGYLVILTLWALARFGRESIRNPASVAMWGAALFGTLFSAYLTFLEPFVIGATCAWCLTSSVIMALLLWASAPLAARAWPGKGRESWRREEVRV
jgi:uncharacterized membrane protein